MVSQFFCAPFVGLLTLFAMDEAVATRVVSDSNTRLRITFVPNSARDSLSHAPFCFASLFGCELILVLETSTILALFLVLCLGIISSACNISRMNLSSAFTSLWQETGGIYSQGYLKCTDMEKPFQNHLQRTLRSSYWWWCTVLLETDRYTNAHILCTCLHINVSRYYIFGTSVYGPISNNSGNKVYSTCSTLIC